MNEEIQEILDDLQNEDCYWLDCGRKNTSLTDEEAHLLLNYISNLQNRIDKAVEIVEDLYSEKEICKYQYDKYMNILKESGE